jgi:hypothetical protein
MMGRKAWIAFAAVQIAGEICAWTWAIPYGPIGRWQWMGAFILLLPGNELASIIIEKLFWMSGMSLLAMQVLKIPLVLGINLALWIACAWVWRRVYRSVICG